jgi:hypothetical protein
MGGKSPKSSPALTADGAKSLLDRKPDRGAHGSPLTLGLRPQLLGERDRHPGLDDGAGTFCGRSHSDLLEGSAPVRVACLAWSFYAKAGY